MTRPGQRPAVLISPACWSAWRYTGRPRPPRLFLPAGHGDRLAAGGTVDKVARQVQEPLRGLRPAGPAGADQTTGAVPAAPSGSGGAAKRRAQTATRSPCVLDLRATEQHIYPKRPTRPCATSAARVSYAAGLARWLLVVPAVLALEADADCSCPLGRMPPRTPPAVARVSWTPRSSAGRLLELSWRPNLFALKPRAARGRTPALQGRRPRPDAVPMGGQWSIRSIALDFADLRAGQQVQRQAAGQLFVTSPAA